MGREHIEFIEAGDVAAGDVTTGMLAGTTRRLLSEDDANGASTALHGLSAGWIGDLGAESARPIELFVLTGAIRVAGEAVGEGCYAFLPAGGAERSVSADGAAQVLVMIDPEREGASGGPAKIVDPSGERWLSADLGGADIPPGICIKLLHEDAETKDWTWVAATVPAWQENRAEIHDTIEECLMIRGDTLLGERGVMKPGSYFWRPPMVRHGPMFTHHGGYFFFRSKGGGLTVEYEAVPGWEKMIDDYIASDSFYGGDLN
jgi:hypothetical protein